jgi:hypothetical protein
MDGPRKRPSSAPEKSETNQSRWKHANPHRARHACRSVALRRVGRGATPPYGVRHCRAIGNPSGCSAASLCRGRRAMAFRREADAGKGLPAYDGRIKARSVAAAPRAADHARCRAGSRPEPAHGLPRTGIAAKFDQAGVVAQHAFTADGARRSAATAGPIPARAAGARQRH